MSVRRRDSDPVNFAQQLRSGIASARSSETDVTWESLNEVEAAAAPCR